MEGILLSQLQLTIEIQKSPFHCFPACLVSFFKDLKLSLTQDEIVEKCPIEFAKDSAIEGAFSDENLSKIAPVLGFSFSELTDTFDILHPKETVFFMTAWEGDESKIHWVRWSGQDATKIFLMNPSKGEGEILLSEFNKWPKHGYKITKA